MNLVNELQVSAEQDDVLTVLRKTKRLASKLGRADISDWLRCEQHGYYGQKAVEVPDYREIGNSWAFRTTGYVPAGFGMVMNGVIDLPGPGLGTTVPYMEPISTVTVNIESISEGNEISIAIKRWSDLDKRIRSRFQIDPMVENQITFLLKLNSAQLKAIPDQIKDRVLDWACALETAGLTGEGMSFSSKEKEIAHTVVFNISHSHIEQLTNSGANQQGPV